MCQVATVVMETTQLVSHFKNFITVNGELNKVPKMISKHCELVKLCHINRSGPVFLRHSVCLSSIISEI